MKLRVLFLSVFLAFGLLFSSVSVTHAAVINDTFIKIKQVLELLTAEETVDTNPAKTSLQNVGGSLVEVAASKSFTLTAIGEESALAQTTRAVAMIYENAPASGETYVADLLHNMKIGPAQPAYAQVGGLGFAALEPVLYAWKQFRNIAYLFFIVITLIVGFMIMMRQKVGSQAAVTAQQAIPQIVIALITVTFSYAIAGFLIDMMYVIMFLFVGLFPEAGVEDTLSRNLIDIAGGMFIGGISTAQSSVQNFISAELGEGAAAEAIGWVSGLAFAVIIAFAYLFAMIALFFELLKTYIAIIVSIVLSPLLLMIGALPGRKDVFTDWIKGIAANLVAFPVFLLLVILHKLMTSQSSIDGGFLPPFLMGRGNAGAITSLIGLSIMLISKDLVVQAKKSFNPKGTGIFEQFGSALSSSVSKGWKGGELVPGVGFTDTNKLPGGKYLGSGKKVLQTGVSGLGGLTSGVVGGGYDYEMAKRQAKGSPLGGSYRGSRKTAFLNRFGRGAKDTGSFVGHEKINNQDKKSGDKKTH
jgi:hypothetical protein